MPEKETIERAIKAQRRGKSPSTQSGEFVREEMHHIREGKHGARSTKQAIAIGLSKARRAGVDLPLPERVSEKPGAVPLVPMIKVGAATSRRLRAGREPENEHSSARDAARRQEKHSPNKRAPQHDTAREPRDRLQLDKLREQKGRRGRSKAARKAAR